ncbi:MAG: transcription termination/antitermination factor NusG [Spirochaetales bacterium]|nr:transcription termination/antitermination factor NusG [Spirochaetales bacterium]
MSKGWYVVHVYSGHENKVERQIRVLLKNPDLAEFIFDIKVPQEEVAEIKDGKKKVTTKKFLPGYILVEMDLSSLRWKEVCSHIRQIQGVTGFVGFSMNQKPQPISQEEARSILQKTGEIKAERMVKPKQSFTIGESVKIVDGPFDTFTGTVEEVNLEKGKLRVMVGIFGRATPVEVDFLQVEKV